MLDAPARPVGPILEGHAQTREAVADLVGQPEILLLAQPGTELDQETEQGGGQDVLGVRTSIHLAAEQAEDPAELLERDHAGAILVEPARPRVARLRLGLMGEPIERVDDLEELAERTAGV